MSKHKEIKCSIPEETILRWRGVTGWDRSKVINTIGGIICTEKNALDVYLCSAQMPSFEEQEIINRFGFMVWKSMYEKRLFK